MPSTASQATPVSLPDGPTILHIGGGVIEVHVSTDGLRVSRTTLLEYVEHAARAMANYYGHFPVARVQVEITPGGGGRRINGRESNGRHISLGIGTAATDAKIAHDWTATHEMFHLAFPDLDSRYNWMNEGLSDYLEPIARARIGQLTPEDVWRGFVEGMPQGLPQPGDKGLDNTHTWANTYWGGNIYWLLADVQIREQTHNRRSLDDALRAILKAGGNGGAHWPISRVLEVGDRATGTAVLADLHQKMGPTPFAPDLDALWKQLGVRHDNGQISFNDAAPLAAVRKAITARDGR